MRGFTRKARRIARRPRGSGAMSFPFSCGSCHVCCPTRPVRIFCAAKNRRRSTGNNNTALMDEIKFRCPECAQKIAVEAAAAGVKIDCPTCHSQLAVPHTGTGTVEVIVRRKLAIIGGSADEVYAELQKAQAQAAKATEELNQSRAMHTAALQEARNDVDTIAAAREALEKEAAALRPLRDELAAAQKSLSDAAAREAQMEAASASAAALRAELSDIQAAHAETQSRLAAVNGQFAALQGERDEFAKAAGETAELRGQIAGARKEIDRFRKDAETASAAHGAQLDAARGIETGVRAELAAVQRQHTQAEARLAEQAAKLAESEAGRTDLTGILEELLPLREELAKSQREVCNLCESSAEKARDYESRLEAAEKQTAEQAGSLEVAVKRVTELQSEAAMAKLLRDELAGARGELDRLRKGAEEAGKIRDDAGRKDDEALSKARAAEKTLREYGEALNAKLADAERRNAAVANGFTAIKQEHADLTAELRVMRKERDDAAALAAGHSKQIGTLEPAVESAKGEIARLREAADAAGVADKKEIERLTLLVESAEAAAKIRIPLPQPPASLRKVADLQALAESDRQRAENAAALESAQKAGREAAERAKKSEEERSALAAELSRKSAEFDALNDGAARLKAELDQFRSQPEGAQAGTPAPAGREMALEAERDALAAALERAKQHVGVLQARRDMLRDEVATLRTRLGIGGKVTSGDEKPIAK